MQLTLLQIHELYNVLNGLDKIHLPIKIGYRLACIANQLEKDENFYTSTFNALLQEYGAYDEHNKLIYSEETHAILLKEETLQEGKQKFTELQSQIHDIELTPIKLSELPDINITVEEIRILLPILEDDSELSLDKDK